MTLDALLAILLNVAIPSLMAVAGGILAIRTYRDAKGPERWAWVSVFVFLFIVAVVLGFVQQVRLTSQQKDSDEKTAAAELRSSGEIKFMQGQLDSINKVLTAVVSRPGDAGLAKDLLKALASQASEASKSGNMVSVLLTPPKEGRPDLGWSYTWTHGLNTLTPVVSCVDSNGEQRAVGLKITDSNTAVLTLPRIAVNCTLRK